MTSISSLSRVVLSTGTAVIVLAFGGLVDARTLMADSSNYSGGWGADSVVIDGKTSRDAYRGRVSKKKPPTTSSPAVQKTENMRAPSTTGLVWSSARRMVPTARQSKAQVISAGGMVGASAALCGAGLKEFCPAPPASRAPARPAARPAAPQARPQPATTETKEEVPEVSASDFAVLPIKAPKVGADLDGFGLRNGVTNIYVTGGVQVLQTDVLGQGVQVRATPVAYAFDYGDGSPINRTKKPGAPLPVGTLRNPDTAFETDTATSHRYKETGTYYASVTTTFSGEYRVAGGPWQQIQGTTDVSGAPFTIDIWRTTHLHVTEPCRHGQTTAGCNGYIGSGTPTQPP